MPKVWIGHDIGKVINPYLVQGQVEGSVYMAIGEALMEEQVFRKGMHKMPSLLEYKSPTFLEMPEVDTSLIESLDPKGPYGAKEAGQGPLLPVLPALANAVYDALGVRIDEIPITPEKSSKRLSCGTEARSPEWAPEAFRPSLSRPCARSSVQRNGSRWYPIQAHGAPEGRRTGCAISNKVTYVTTSTFYVSGTSQPG